MQLVAQHLAEIIEMFHQREAGASGQEKRRAARIDLVARMTVWPILDGMAARQFTVLTRDISYSGVGIFLPLGLHETQQFIMELPLKHSLMRVLGDVRYCRALADSIYGVGAEFTRLLADNETLFLDPRAAARLQKIQDSILA